MRIMTGHVSDSAESDSFIINRTHSDVSYKDIYYEIKFTRQNQYSWKYNKIMEAKINANWIWTHNYLYVNPVKLEKCSQKTGHNSKSLEIL